MPPRRQLLADGDARRDADIAQLGRNVETLAAALEELRLTVTAMLPGRHKETIPPHGPRGDDPFLSDDESDTLSNVNPFAPPARGDAR